MNCSSEIQDFCGVPFHLKHHKGGDRKIKKSETDTYIWNPFVNLYTRSWKYPILLAWEPQLVRSLPWSRAGGRFITRVLSTRPSLFSKHNRLRKLAWYKEQEHHDFKSASCPLHVDEKNKALIAWCGKILALPSPLIGMGSQRTAIQMCLAAVGAHKLYQLQQRQWTPSATQLLTG